MKSTKSIPLKAVNYGLPADILSTIVNEDTVPRVILRGEMGFSASRKSRKNTTCIVCGLPKTTRGSMHRECYMKARQIKCVLVCARCGKEFERPRYAYEKALKMGCSDAYCSVECSRAHHAVKNSHPYYCKVCGASIGKGKIFCSQECKHQFLIGRRRKLKDKVCPVCLDAFIPKSSRTTYCSPVCKNLAHSLRMSGAGNSHFKTGTSYAKHFREMRPLILERDNYRCVLCGTPETMVSTNHPINQERSNMIIHHLDINPANNVASNLVSLCQHCHAIHHHSFVTPFKKLPVIVQQNMLSMTSKLRERIITLQTEFASKIATSV